MLFQSKLDGYIHESQSLTNWKLFHWNLIIMNYAILLNGEHNHNPPDFNDFAEEATIKGDFRNVALKYSLVRPTVPYRERCQLQPHKELTNGKRSPRKHTYVAGI